jgi:membrane protein
VKKAIEKFLRTHPPIRFAVDVVDVYFSKRVGRAAAELAYFLILTFFPILICVSTFVNELHLDPNSLLEQADPFLPAGVLAIFQDYLTYIDTNQSAAMLITGAILTILFASSAVRGLMNFIQELYGRATFSGLWQVIASLLFSVLLLVTIYLSLAVVVTGNWFFHLLGQVFKLEGLVERFGAWQSIKYLLLLAMVFLFILLLYRFAAPLNRPRPPVVPGALAAAAALAIASMVFSVLMGNSTRYSLIYGSLASVIIMLVWLYLCGNILIMGNVINYVLFTHRKEARR